MSDFIVSLPGFNVREHERAVEAAIQAAVLAALAGLPHTNPGSPIEDFSTGAFFMPPRGWRGLIRVPTLEVDALPAMAKKKLTVTAAPIESDK
jgi:hypothetical protein